MSKDSNWSEENALVLAVVESTELVPMKKWGTDIYTINGKNVMSFHGFKNHFSIWFNNGVFLKDPKKILEAATDTTKAMRHWKIKDVSEMDADVLKSYILEAIQNEKDGKVWKPQKTAEIAVPDYLKSAFIQTKGLQMAFEKLSPYKQKEYLSYITSAKKAETNIKRMEKAIPKIIAGQGINDQYK